MRDKSYKMACVFGGTGFLGRQIVGGLARAGYIVKVATRTPEKAFFLKTAGNTGQIVPLACSASDEAAIRSAVRGCEVVVNCVGILSVHGKSTFTRIHTELPRAIAKACVAEKVARFVHISALGCEQSGSKYGKSKLNGELAVHENFPKATVLRPSVIFGPDDNFFNLFGRLSTLLPFLPLIGGGYTKFQPVYVGDVAAAVLKAVSRPETEGHIYELGGPEILTFRQIYERLFRQTGRERCLVSLPWGIAKLQGRVLGILPNPPLTSDQVESLKTDNVVSVEAKTLADLGVEATALDMVLPSYLARFRPGGRFGDKKRA